MFEEFSHTIISMIEDNMWIGPLLALIAGLCTSLTPCGLSNIPLITGFVAAGDREGDTRRSLVMSLIFAIGAACTFIFCHRCCVHIYNTGGFSCGSRYRLWTFGNFTYNTGNFDVAYGFANVGNYKYHSPCSR